VLAASRERMRVASDSQSDTIELHEVDAHWYTEEGVEIEIEALIPIASVDVVSNRLGVLELFSPTKSSYLLVEALAV
jgi:hypothetical protein